MRIVLLCATNRGYRFLEKLITLLSENTELVVFSFREEAWEPPFLEDIRKLTLANNGQFFERKQVANQRQFWDTTNVDLMLVVSWRYMIPADVYLRAKRGAFVFHDSLLPEYRGFSPTVWAMINGEENTGVTMFHIADAVDSGDIVAQAPVAIGPNDTIMQVMENVTQGYLKLIERTFHQLLQGTAPRVPQDHSKATFTCRRLPEDNLINWLDGSDAIYNLIRAVTRPYPGAFTYLAGQKIRIWSAQRLDKPKPYVGRIPGRVAEIYPGVGSVVVTGDGSLLLTEAQTDDSEATCAADIFTSLSHTLSSHL